LYYYRLWRILFNDDANTDTDLFKTVYAKGKVFTTEIVNFFANISENRFQFGNDSRNLKQHQSFRKFAVKAIWPWQDLKKAD